MGGPAAWGDQRWREWRLELSLSLFAPKKFEVSQSSAPNSARLARMT
jgi:hypothetical protein